MLPLADEHHPRVATVVAAGLVALVVAAGIVAVAGGRWPALGVAGQLLGLVGLLVFLAGGFLYTAMVIRDLVAGDRY